jgi:DNA polymerase epsilon subunit 1
MARGSNTRSRGSFRGFRGHSSFRGRGRGGSHGAKTDAAPKQDDEGTRLAERFEQIQVYDDIDGKLGFSRIQEGPKKEGWLVNMHPVECNFSILTWSVRRVVRLTKVLRGFRIFDKFV